MDTIIDAFHIDIKLFIAQIVNFAIVFAVLFYFVIKPLMKVMKERAEKIETSLKEASDISDKLTKTEADYEATLAKAQKEAAEIMKEATEKAEIKKEEMVKKAKDEIGQIITKEKEGIRADKDRTMNEIREELGDIVLLAVEKVLDTKMDSKVDKELISKIVK